jgi:hypothetical protein
MRSITWRTASSPSNRRSATLSIRRQGSTYTSGTDQGADGEAPMAPCADDRVPRQTDSRKSVGARLEATGDEGFAPMVHEAWTDRIHGAPLRTGPDQVLTCAFKKLPSFSSGVTDTVRARSAPLYGWR